MKHAHRHDLALRQCAMALTLLTGPWAAGAGGWPPPGEAPRPPADAPPGPPAEALRRVEDLHWSMRPGVRIAMLRARVPTVDRVVLVPDEATFLEAISQWSLAGRWPVLIEDDVYAPMFIRRFRPAEVIRKAPTEAALPRGADLESAMRGAAASAWRPGDAAGASADSTMPPPDMKERLEAAGWTAPGVVITSGRDRAWPAALALAADRGQPLAFLDERYGSPDGYVKAEDWPRLAAAVESLVAAAGYPWDQLGDAVDTITIVRDLPVKYAMPGDPAPASRYAVTDGLARHGDHRRWAVAGWIFGEAPRATYMAMCAIFLAPQSALLFDTYPDEPGWARYALSRPAERLSGVGFECDLTASPESTAAAWERLAPRGLNRDLILVNTKGNHNWFDAADKGRVFVHDVPILNAPAAVHFVHSWSCIRPADRDTLGGRWLERGAYAYVGSVHEPTLAAFVPPELLTERMLASVPFLVAARVWEGTPWRVATIGDPLMTLLRPAPRVSDDDHPIEGESLREVLRHRTPEALEGGQWAEVMRTVNLLGLDPLALSLYEERLKDAADGEAIAAALGPVFRQSDAASLLHAIEQIPASQVTPAQRDMLWLKCGPTLRSIDDAAALNLLERHVRTPLGYVDACRLAPLMKRLGRRGDVEALLSKYESDAKDNYSRELIRAARP